MLLLALFLWLVAPGCKSHGSADPPAGGGAAAPTALTTSLRMAALRARQKAPGYDFVSDADGTWRARAGSYGATVEVAATERGVRLEGGGFHLGVETTHVGRGTPSTSPGVRGRRAEGQELVLEREEGVEERYLAGPLGVEQSYVVGARPEGRELLSIEVAFEGLSPERVEGATDQVRLRDEAGLVRAGYRDLAAVDARGRELAARMEVRGASVALVIDDTGATYPVRVDPLVWAQQGELTASDGPVAGEFGFSVAVSGGTAVVGAIEPSIGKGAAYVFVQSGTTWTQQAELTASPGVEADRFGTSVAVSGGTAIVGADGHTAGTTLPQGAAYVFVQSGTTWTLEAELTASDGGFSDEFGHSVALSDGTAIVGAIGHEVGGNAHQGAAYVFVQSGATWTLEAELTASDGKADDWFGNAVALSGGTALVGALYHEVGANTEQGAAYVFVQSGTTWTQQAELTASDGKANDWFGYSVALSGGTAIVGATGYDIGSINAPGTAYIFVQSGTTWTQEAQLTASDGADDDQLGNSVALSGDTAFVGAYQHQSANAYGAAYVFVAGMGCLIGGVGYAAGTVNPGDACQACAPATSPTAWSNRSDGTPCDDGDACTHTDTCTSGVCAGTAPVACAASDECHDAGTCDKTTGTCSNPAKADGTACSMGTCSNGACTPQGSTTSGAGGAGSTVSTGGTASTGGGVTTAGTSIASGCSTSGGDDAGAWLSLGLLLLARRKRGATPLASPATGR